MSESRFENAEAKRLGDEAELLCPHKDLEEEELRKMIRIGDTAEGS
jgi:hypothetical protein